MIVSIPFQRESVSKGRDNRDRNIAGVRVSIPFTTGKCIARVHFRCSRRHTIYRCVSIPFQTGKCIASPVSRLNGALLRPGVSIPFKRESVLQVLIPKKKKNDFLSFNSLSNGKVYCKKNIETTTLGQQKRFQFPSKRDKCIGKPQEILRHDLVQEPSFQFPSNGKVYWQVNDRFGWLYGYIVSIPFKREKCIAR